MDISSAIALDLLQIKAIKIQPQNPFTWASGIVSPVYCDNRMALSYPEVRSRIIEGFRALSENFQGVDLVAGVATAGIPHAALLADRLAIPMCYVRSTSKSHGRQNLIEGNAKSGSRCLLIEDLISTGGSCIKAAEALANAGVDVVSVLSIFTYGFDSAKVNLERAGLEHRSITNLQVLMGVAKDKGLLSEEDLQVVEKWRSDF